MAEDQTTTMALDGDRQRFEQILLKALKSRGNLLVLARCAEQLQLKSVETRARALVVGEGLLTDIDRGRALWELLREAIERLRPGNAEPEPTPAWRLYAIAEGVYIRGKPARAMTVELDLSPRTFHRQRQAAVEALATIVWQIEKQLHHQKQERS